MTQDNKDAALELADTVGITDHGTARTLSGEKCRYVTDRQFSAYYNAARKPLEELLQKSSWAEAEAMTLVISHEEVIEKLQQQLLATQDAYQRVAKALDIADNFVPIHGRNEWVNSQIDIINAAIANPPSLEALERKKLEDEIVVLEEVWTFVNHGEMIAVRKAKLEKMK